MMSPHAHWQLSRTQAERRLVKRGAQLLLVTGLACTADGMVGLPALRAGLGYAAGTAVAWLIAAALISGATFAFTRFDPWRKG